MCRRTFTDAEIASFMEMKTMGIASKRIAKEYKCGHQQIENSVAYAKKHGMAKPELASQGPRFVQRGRAR